MTPSFAALAIYVLGQVGYTPYEIKYETPLYEINQILRAPLVSQGVVMEWNHYEHDEELSKAFEQIKEQWQYQQKL